MSRIHEALKRAEMERSAQAVETPPVDEQQVSAAVQERDTVAAIAADSPLEFEWLKAHCARPQWHLNPNMNLFFDSRVNGDAAEQFRTLRSRLYQIRDSQSMRTLLITSPVPEDGKTFVTNNLAQSIIRQPDRRVLMIDADLRASRLHIPMGAPKVPGLSDYLSGDLDEAAVMQRGQANDLFLIPGGNAASNPSELLSNGRLKQLLDRVTPIFDWVIIDSPPCLPVADARVIADFCDGALLVLRAGATPMASAQRATQELQAKNIVGIVLNVVAEGAFAYSSYYGSAYDGTATKAQSIRK
jgi:capsular exopolysaccharide synthesis family protein